MWKQRREEDPKKPTRYRFFVRSGAQDMDATFFKKTEKKNSFAHGKRGQGGKLFHVKHRRRGERG